MKPAEPGRGQPLGPGGSGLRIPGMFLPRTLAGRAGLSAVLSDPPGALIGLDFDGTLSPIVEVPARARAHPGAVAALRALAGRVGTLAILTGRPAASVVQLGGLAQVPGLVVFGHYGWERWADGQVSSPPSPPGVAAARERLPGLLADAGAPPGTWIEDKGHAVAVHTRRTADPGGALRLLRGPLDRLAAAAGLLAQPGRMVIELRPPGTDKGAVLLSLASQRAARAVLFCGDDLGDLPAFAAVGQLRGKGVPGLAVCSGSAEVSELAEASDLVVDGPAGVVALLDWLGGRLGSSPPGRAQPSALS